MVDRKLEPWLPQLPDCSFSYFFKLAILIAELKRASLGACLVVVCVTRRPEGLFRSRAVCGHVGGTVSSWEAEGAVGLGTGQPPAHPAAFRAPDARGCPHYGLHGRQGGFQRWGTDLCLYFAVILEFVRKPGASVEGWWILFHLSGLNIQRLASGLG